MSTSTDTGSDGNDPQTPTHITLELSEDGEVWNVRGEDTSVAAQGERREEAVKMSEALAAPIRNLRFLRTFFEACETEGLAARG